MLNCIPGTKLLTTEPMGSQKGNVWPPLLVVLLGKVNIDRDKCHDGKRRARKGIMEGEAFLAKSREHTETVMRCGALVLWDRAPASLPPLHVGSYLHGQKEQAELVWDPPKVTVILSQ